MILRRKVEKHSALDSAANAMDAFLMKNVSAALKQEYLSLNVGQRLVYHAILYGGNILLTGGGGVGKSHLIRFLAKYIPDLVLTASTGIAGVNIDGDTIDSFMGFSPDEDSNRKPLSASLVEKLRALKILLIDEVSMIRSDKLDAIDRRLRQARLINKPFGGVQVILAGDFCQLPPVVNDKTREGKAFLAHYGDRVFAFESQSYLDGHFTPYVLTEYVRNGDPLQRRILRNLRMGHKVPEAVSFINARAGGDTTENSIRICKTNAQVKKLNDEYFAALEGKAHTFVAEVENTFDLDDLVVEQEITLKVGCRVLICVNSNEGGYRNGDLGIIERFCKDGIQVKLDRGARVMVTRHKWTNTHYTLDNEGNLVSEALGAVSQYPLRVGIAITGHKSQGMTLDSAIVDLSGRFNPAGLTYVVISRVTSFDRLKLTKPLTVKDVAFSEKATQFTRWASETALARRKSDMLMLPADL